MSSMACARLSGATRRSHPRRRAPYRHGPISRDSYVGPYFQHQLVRIYLILGEREKALDLLEPLLKIPYYLSPGWLRIDPDFAPLKGHPRFEKLLRLARGREEE